MDKKQQILKLLLDELKIPTDIKTVDDRILIQKAVYFGQLSGADLGYRFSWYVFGPYCTDLADVYYGLSNYLKSTGGVTVPGKLSSTVTDKLEKAKKIFIAPDGFSQADWLELLASVHYLWYMSDTPPEKALEIMNKQKPKLAKHIDQAQKALKDAGFTQ
jgi:uncharacterized protein YwgA